MIDSYFRAIISHLETIRASEAESIKAAAEACAAAMENDGVVHIYDTGHLVSGELIGRAGGPVGYAPFNFSFSVNNPVLLSGRQHNAADEQKLISIALNASAIRGGDVLIVGSVSGKTFRPVELALQAKNMGVAVIGLTGVAHSREIASDHPSGKRLFEVADIVIDTHVDPGDAMLEVPGMERRVCPASGICAAAALWAMTAELCEIMARRGRPITVYRSVNLPGGPEDVKRTQEEYRRKGF